jgi:hypothetical protein
MKSCVEPLNCLADKFLRIIRDIAKANVRVWQTKRADLTYQSVERLLRCDTLEAFKAQLKIESKAWALEGFRHRINHESKFKCNGEEIDEDDDCLETGEGHFKLISQPGEKETISDEWLEVNDRWIMEACKHATFKAAREIKHEATAENGSATVDRLYALAGVVSITGIKQPADFVDIRQSGFKKAMLNLFGALPSSGGASKYKVGVKVKEGQLLVAAWTPTAGQGEGEGDVGGSIAVEYAIDNLTEAECATVTEAMTQGTFAAALVNNLTEAECATVTEAVTQGTFAAALVRTFKPGFEAVWKGDNSSFGVNTSSVRGVMKLQKAKLQKLEELKEIVREKASKWKQRTYYSVGIYTT